MASSWGISFVSALCSAVASASSDHEEKMFGENSVDFGVIGGNPLGNRVFAG